MVVTQTLAQIFFHLLHYYRQVFQLSLKNSQLFENKQENRKD